MAQPGTIEVPVRVHVEVDVQPARKHVKRALKELDGANRELAILEDRCRELEDRLAAEYGIKIERNTP